MMVIGFTLGRYLSRRFLGTIMAVFGTVLALIVTIDFVELMRRAGDAEGASAQTMASLALLRAPSVAEQVLPFAVLFGAIAALLSLSRKLELVVARAAGVSAWEFLQPGVLVALLVGVLSVAIYNPVSAYMKQKAAEIEARIFAKSSKFASGKDLWIRQRSIDGQAIIRAESGLERTATLIRPTVFGFDAAGSFRERIEARQAKLHEGYWELSDARVLSVGDEPQSFGTYLLATTLRPEQVRRSFTPAEFGAVLEPRRGDRADRKGRIGRDPLPAAPGGADGPAAAPGRHGLRGGIGFLKVFPRRWRVPHGPRWRRGRLHALCRHRAHAGFRSVGAGWAARGGLAPGGGG